MVPDLSGYGKEKGMDDTTLRRGFKWRWIIVIAAVVFVLASEAAVGLIAYRLGREQGYSQLEKEIVYAIAIHNSKRVGNFLVAKVDNGGTIIALNENPFDGEIKE